MMEEGLAQTDHSVTSSEGGGGLTKPEVIQSIDLDLGLTLQVDVFVKVWFISMYSVYEMILFILLFTLNFGKKIYTFG